ncbi:unnamed protein product [Plutella xylostella]|uniref:(diamondback moth) hypothetical protein n=1 Tax=Plutella xylostella TaxID=51655 RepID=A0A8S4FV34_PLUXY|nr:unnamed protein product [Plutella xylostella]
MANTLHLLASVSCLSLAAAYWGPDLPPGPYCGRTNECCSDRRDSCAHRILDTLCYCDQFCNHTASHDDCCPDYPEVCLGRRPEEVPVPLKQPCRHRGQLFMPGAVRMEDCNSCECVEGQDGLTTWVCQSDPCLVSGEVLARVHQRGGSWRAYNYTQFQGKKLKDGLVYYLDGLTTWVCQSDPCLVSGEVLARLSQRGGSWRAYNYTQFQGKKLKDGLVYYLGTLPLSRETQRMGAIRYNKEPDYPAHFDSRSRWPRYISPARDQGWCGADWAVALADVVSDRFAIQSNGAETLALSPQVFLSCNRRGQQGCRGGHIDVAWSFAKSHGLVDEECLPYVANVTRCPFRPRHDLVQDGCRPRNPQRTSRYKVGPPSRLKREEDIMYDIMESGPVQARVLIINVTRCPFRPRHDLVQDGCRPRNPQRTSRYKVGPPSRLKREEDIMYDIMESGPVQDGCRPRNPQRTSRYKVGPPSRLKREEDIMYDIMESGPVQGELLTVVIINVTRCPFRPRQDLVQDGCRPRNPQRTSRYKVGPPSRLKREEDIMYDIMESGPVQAILTVHQDFFHYRDGIYRRSHYGDNKLQGLHAVRIVGWGEDQGDKYWIVANSWGPEWGENGFFRIARGVNESGIESFVVTVLVEVIEANRRK